MAICRICGEFVLLENDIGFRRTYVGAKQKKPGSTLYFHKECYENEQKELKQNDAEKMDE